MNHVEIAYSIPGQTWPRELNWLRNAFNQSRVHVEVGVYCGRSFYVSCMGLPQGAVAIAVDDDSEPTVGTGFPHLCDKWVKTNRGMTIDAIKLARPDLAVEFWKMSSLAASQKLLTLRASEYRHGMVSVFIDGAHDYESVTGDILAWLPHVKSTGGIICGHDYWAANHPVMDAVENSLGESFSVVNNTRIWLCDSKNLP